MFGNVANTAFSKINDSILPRLLSFKGAGNLYGQYCKETKKIIIDDNKVFKGENGKNNIA